MKPMKRNSGKAFTNFIDIYMYFQYLWLTIVYLSYKWDNLVHKSVIYYISSSLQIFLDFTDYYKYDCTSVFLVVENLSGGRSLSPSSGTVFSSVVSILFSLGKILSSNICFEYVKISTVKHPVISHHKALWPTGISASFFNGLTIQIIRQAGTVKMNPNPA